MFRCPRLSGLAAFLCVLGCSHDQLLVSPAVQEYSGVVVPRSVGYVSATLQDALFDAGIPVVAKRDGYNQRLVGMTKSGKVFCLHLRPLPEARNQSTVVSVEWGRDADEQFWNTINDLLRALPPANVE
jgi:hypothetical protein